VGRGLFASQEVITVGLKQVQRIDPEVKSLVGQVAAHSRHGNAAKERAARRKLALAMQRQHKRETEELLASLRAEAAS
jgi:hypothetical protein